MWKAKYTRYEIRQQRKHWYSISFFHLRNGLPHSVSVNTFIYIKVWCLIVSIPYLSHSICYLQWFVEVNWLMVQWMVHFFFSTTLESMSLSCLNMCIFERRSVTDLIHTLNQKVQTTLSKLFKTLFRQVMSVMCNSCSYYLLSKYNLGVESVRGLCTENFQLECSLDRPSLGSNP